MMVPVRACDPAAAMENSPECKPYLDANNAGLRKLTDAKNRDILGYVATGVGGAAALLGVYLLISGDPPHRYDRKNDDNPMSLRVTPVVGPSGLGLVGSF